MKLLPLLFAREQVNSASHLQRPMGGIVIRPLGFVSLLFWASALVAVPCGAENRNTSIPDGVITTVVGTGRAAASPVRSPTATNLGNPFGVEVSADGSLYICEVSNHRVWRLTHPNHPDRSRLEVIAGTGKAGYSGDGGSAKLAALNEPYEIRFDASGNIFFVEMKNHLVRKIDLDGVIHTVAGTGVAGFSGDGGDARNAQLNRPHSIVLDGRGSLYVADIGNHRIRRIDLSTGVIESFAGTTERRLPMDQGAVTGEPVLGPRALYITGRTLWVALREGHSLWKIDLDAPRWQAVAGTGKRGYSGDGGHALQATLNGPKGVTVDADGNVFIVDTENQAIRRIDATSQKITTIVGRGPTARGFDGDNVPSNKAELNRPHGICVDAHGTLFIGDSENHRVRRVRVRP